MNTLQQKAGKGLFYLFLGQILSIAIFIIPFLGFFAGLAGLILSTLGVFTLSTVDEGYKKALYLTIASFVLNIINSIVTSGAVSTLFMIASSLISLFVVYLICTTTASFMEGMDQNLAGRATLIWKIYAACTVVSIICILMQNVFLIGILFTIISGLAGLVQIVGIILYMMFLYQSQKLLR